MDFYNSGSLKILLRSQWLPATRRRGSVSVGRRRPSWSVCPFRASVDPRCDGHRTRAAPLQPLPSPPFSWQPPCRRAAPLSGLVRVQEAQHRFHVVQNKVGHWFLWDVHLQGRQSLALLHVFNILQWGWLILIILEINKRMFELQNI